MNEDSWPLPRPPDALKTAARDAAALSGGTGR